MKLKIIDRPCENNNIDNIPIITDESKMIVDTEYYQLPFTHVKETVTQHTYELHKNASLTLVIEYVDNEYNNFYFTL